MLLHNVGIAGHLRAGFLAIIGFVMLAAAAGVYAVVDISAALNDVTRNRVPSTVAAQELARRTQVVVDTAPQIPAATTAEQFETRRDTLFEDVRKLRRLVEKVQGAGLALDRVPFKQLVVNLDDNLSTLSETVSRKLLVRADLDHRTETWNTNYQALISLLKPVFQVRRARLEGLQEAMETFAEGSTARLTTGHELRRRLQTFMPLQELRVALAQLNDGFLAAMELRDIAALQTLEKRLHADLKTIETLLQGLDIDAATLIQGRFARMRATLTGPDNAIDLRREETRLLEGVDRLLDENDTLSAELSAAVDVLVRQTNRQIDEAAREAQQTKVTGFALLLGVIALSVVSTALIMRYYVERNVIRRLALIRDAMLALSRGELDHPLPPSSGDEVGRMAYTLMVFRDNAVRLEDRTRELQAARDTAMKSNEAKTRFLANMSHELRTPLNAVIGFAEIIRNESIGPLGEPRYRDYASDIYDSAAHLLEVINDILDVAKAEAGKLEMQEESVDAGQMIGKVVRQMQPRAEDSGVTLVSDLPAESPRLIVDPRRLRQILFNLISNAVKFTPEGGRVGIELVRCPDGGVAIEVCDSGIGMTNDELEVALAPFSQIDNSFSRHAEGTGLGLPLTKHLIELHGGVFEILSEKNKGTRSRAILPPERLDTAANGALAQETGKASGA